MMKRDLYSDASLLKRLLVEDLSEDDKQKILRLLEERGLSDVYKEVKESSYVKDRFSDYEKYSAKEAYQLFLKRQKRKRSVLRVLPWMAAAVLLGVFWGGYWLFLDDQVVKDDVREFVIPAGMTQARLTLADGRVVNISQIDTLIEEGVAVEYKDGELAYKETTSIRDVVYNELEVPLGGECTILLNDGTRVWVNSGSKLKYPLSFVDKERCVYLEGEAFFEVEKADKPFIVKNFFGDVRVLGTAFGVTAYRVDSVGYTTLVRGSVCVKNNLSDSLIIYPGEQVVSLRDGKMIKRDVDVEEYVGWKDGAFIFKERRLEDIVKILERWYNIHVVFQDDELKDFLFTGYLDRYKDINVFFNALRRTGKVEYKFSEPNMIILMK